MASTFYGMTKVMNALRIKDFDTDRMSNRGRIEAHNNSREDRRGYWG